MNTVLDEVGSILGLDNLQVGAGGVCRILFDEHLIIDIETHELDEYMVIHSVVAKLADEPSVETYQALLAANMQAMDSYGLCFCADLESREVVLSSRFCMKTSSTDDFIDLLQEFVNYLEIWLNKLQNSELDSTVESTAKQLEQHSILEPLQGNGLRL